MLPLLVLLLIALPSGTAFAQDDTSEPRIVLTIGHSGDVAAAAFSPDSRIVASAGGDHTVKLWDAASGRELRTLKGHSRELDAVAFSPDGRTVASGSGDSFIKLWDVASGRELRTLKGHSRDVAAVAFSPDGRIIASGSFDKTLKLWDAASGRELRTLKGHSREVNAVAFSPDGRTLVSGSWDKTIRLWDVASGRELRTLNGHSDQVTTVAFSPDGRTIVSGSWDKTLKLWDAASGRELHTLQGHADWVNAAAFSPDGRFIVSGGAEGALILWDAATGRGLGREQGHPQGVKTVAVSPDGRTFVSGSLDATLKLWDASNGHELRTLAGQSEDVSAVAFSPDGRTIASGSGGQNLWSQDNSLRLWDAASGRELRMLKGHSDGVNAIVFSSDGRTVASASRDNSVKLWDAASGQELRTLTGHSSEVNTVAFSPDSHTVASGSQDTLILWDAASGRQLRTLKVHSSMQLSVAFSPDGRTVASGGGDGAIRLWDVASGRELRTLKGHSNLVTAIAFSPDGRTIVSGGVAGAIKQWDAASGQEVRTLTEHAGEVSTIAFSPDGRIIASAGPLKLWDAANGRELRTFDGGGSAVAFSPDGRTIVSGANHTLLRWDLEGKLLTTTIARTGGEWLTITPEGFFDASENGAKLLSVVQGLDVYSVDQFKRWLSRPDLVREKLAGDPNQAVIAAAAKLDLKKIVSSGQAPRVTIAKTLPATTAERSVTVEASVENQGGGIGQLEWRVNGVAFGLTRPSGSGVQTLRKTLTLAPGENRIEAVAFNEKGYIASVPAEVTVTSTQPPSSKLPKLYVLAAGINAYHAAGLKQLTFAKDDARAIGASLQKSGGRLYDSVEVTTLLDDEVTAAKLEQVFSSLSQKVTPDDVFVLFMSGHGITVDGRFYYVPADYSYGRAEVTSKAIGQEQLQDWLVRIPAFRGVLVVDACQSGSLTEDRVTRSGVEQYTSTQHLNEAIGRAVLSATTDDKPAAEGIGGHGAFTYALLEGLSQADANKDGVVDVAELGRFVKTEVPALTQRYWKISQVPMVKLAGASFPLATRSPDPLVAALSDNNQPIVLASATHTLAGPTAVRQFGDGAAIDITELQAGAKVRVIQTRGDWDLIARDGKIIGYVEAQKLSAIEQTAPW